MVVVLCGCGCGCGVGGCFSSDVHALRSGTGGVALFRGLPHGVEKVAFLVKLTNAESALESRPAARGSSDSGVRALPPDPFHLSAVCLAVPLALALHFVSCHEVLPQALGHLFYFGGLVAASREVVD